MFGILLRESIREQHKGNKHNDKFSKKEIEMLNIKIGDSMNEYFTHTLDKNGVWKGK